MKNMFYESERNCPVCKSREKKKIDEINLVNFDDAEGIFDHQVIVCCEKCGFVYHEGIDMDKLDDYYGSYTGGSQIQTMTADELVLNNNMADFIEYHLKVPKDAKILDIGCGYGWVMEILRGRGYTAVTGMDTDEPLMQKLKEKGLSVEIGTVYSENKENLNEMFDLIILKMVMEHLENPGEAVDNVRRWLKKEGLLVIEVPDCSLYDTAAFFTGYFQSVNMEHINNYSSVSLMNLMRKWRMVACESTMSDGIFPVLRMAFRYEENYERKLICEKNDAEAIRKSLYQPSTKGKFVNEKISSLVGKECAVWGVSAFTRGLLTYTELGKMNIVCFVDRDPYLQTKTLQGKSIISPEELKGFKGTIVISGKKSEKAILSNIQALGYKNEVVCLSQ